MTPRLKNGTSNSGTSYYLRVPWIWPPPHTTPLARALDLTTTLHHTTCARLGFDHRGQVCNSRQHQQLAGGYTSRFISCGIIFFRPFLSSLFHLPSLTPPIQHLIVLQSCISGAGADSMLPREVLRCFLHVHRPNVQSLTPQRAAAICA